MQHQLVALFLFSCFMYSGVGAARGPVPIHPQTAWANTYLMNTLFAMDYLVASAETAQTDASWSAIARFATQQAAARDQPLPRDSRLVQLSAVKGERLDFEDIGVLLGQRQQSYKGHWEALAHSYDLSASGCKLAPEKIEAFIKHQTTLLASQGALNGSALLEPLAKWNTADVRCLLFDLVTRAAGNKEDLREHDPLPLMFALRQLSSPMYQDVSIRIMQVIRLLQTQNYAESLRVLLDLRDQDSAYRLAYDMVQRIYSVKQKGQGAVSLRGF